MMALAMCSGKAIPPPAMSVISSRTPSFNQRRVNPADHVPQEQRLLHADLIAVGVGHDVEHFHLGLARQIDGSLYPRSRPAGRAPRPRSRDTSP
jgi:hypothetical protein